MLPAVVSAATGANADAVDVPSSLPPALPPPVATSVCAGCDDEASNADTGRMRRGTGCMEDDNRRGDRNNAPLPPLALALPLASTPLLVVAG